MRAWSNSLEQSFAAEVSTICRVITITCLNGTIIRRTDLDQAVKIGANVYASASIDASAIRQALDIGNSDGGTLTVNLGDGDGEFTEQTIRSGHFDGASFVLEAVDYMHPEYGTLILWTGTFGDIDFDERGKCEISINGLTSQRSQNLGELYSQECRNDFGDERCRVDVQSLRYDFAVEAVSIDGSIIQSAILGGLGDDKWTNGVVTFLDGDNKDYSVEVMYSLNDGSVCLALQTPYPIVVGENARVIPGCDKTRTKCKFYNNILNYRGEPDVPTVDQQAQNVDVLPTTTSPDVPVDPALHIPIGNIAR